VALAVEVEGVRQASHTTLAVVAPFDPERSSVEAIYALAAPGDRVLLRARVVDGAGRPSPAVADLSFTASAGTTEGRPQSFATGFATQWLTLPDPAPEEVTVRAAVAGEPMARDAVVRVLPRGSPAPADLLEPLASGPLSFHAAIPADGRSSVRVLAAVRDLNGGFLSATPGTAFTASAGTWRGPATVGLGNLATRCLVAPDASGVAEVRLAVSGVPMAGRALIAFHPAGPQEPAQDGCGPDEGPEVPESLPGADSPDGGAPLDGGAASPDAGTGGGVPDAGNTPPPPRSLRGSGCATAGSPEPTSLLALALALAFRRRRPRPREDREPTSTFA
jgi:MYXO-CTERM domain-containing protein